MGALLKFSKGEATLYKPSVPFWLTGDIRDLKIVTAKSGHKNVLVARDNDIPGVFRFGR